MSIDLGIVSNLGNGHQLQAKITVNTKEELRSMADTLVEIAQHEVAKINLPTVKAKVELLKSQIAGHKELMEIVDSSIVESKEKVRKNSAGKVFSIDQKNMDDLAAKRHNAEMELVKLQTQYDLALVELAATEEEAK